MTTPHILIVSEPPPRDDRPATGLALRHRRMAGVWQAAGARVSWAWPATPGREQPVVASGVDALALEAPDQLAIWLDRVRPDILVLGYWELHDWLPARMDCALVLDYVAPRLLERQFEDRDRLPGDIATLLPLLARADQVWVGNARQQDLMVSLLLLAGHDCRDRAPVLEVPIAGDPMSGASAAETTDASADCDCDGNSDSDCDAEPLQLFHGGRDWPWRDSRRWLAALHTARANWRLIDASEQAGFGGFADYARALASADVLVELSDDNLERRFSQSFRMTDALCAGVPVICNRFLPLAAVIEQHEAGWLVDTPDELPALLARLAADRAQVRRRGANALALARARFDAERVYGELLTTMPERSSAAEPRVPLIGHESGRAPGFVPVLRDYLRRWVHQRLRLPFHRFMSRRLAARPRPTRDRAAWVVVSRPDLFPTDHGAAVKIERTAWGLSFHLDEVLLLTDRRDCYWCYRNGEREQRRFPWWLRLLGWPRAFNLLRLMARGLPYSNAFLYLPLVDRGLHARLMWLLARHPVEVVQGEFPAYAHPAVWAQRLFGTGALMVEHNVEYRRIAEQVPELGEAGRQLLKTTEIELANACERVVAVSDNDRELLIQASVRPGRIQTIPHGVDLDAFERADTVDLRAKYSIADDHAVLVYHGIYSYPPNLEAVEELSEVIVPGLAKRGRSAHVIAFGPEPPDRALPGVTFAGPVDDLAGHLKGADLAVIPLRAGGGTRMKILDDFAAGVAVVATAKGAEGIPVTSGCELIIADAPEAIVDAVLALLDDPARRTVLAANARDWVQALDWRAIAGRYVALMRSP
ncbi:MAG: glycosyltransferase family 4 protein [Wenzhouxiangellaceae bacterium]|nr:glycosyltransferase family 4 protein [Wenzhouxiangellaceae bacterium]